MATLTVDRGKWVAAAQRSVAHFTLATYVLISCSSPVPDELPDPDPSQLILLYSGRHENAPRCDPLSDGNVFWEGWIGAPEPIECEPCECKPAQCLLSDRVRLHSSPLCSFGDTVSTIDAGSNWNGTCFGLTHPIPSDSYDAVLIDPPLVTDCQPVSQVPPLRRTNMSFVRACGPDVDVVFTTFLHCYPPQPNGECWDSYRVRREFPLYNDTRTCSPCSCGAPSSDKCRVQTTLYHQAGCSEELGSVLISGLDQPLCTDTIQGQIGAVRSIFVKDEPTCAPSTDSKVISGELEPGDTHVLCCNR